MLKKPLKVWTADWLVKIGLFCLGYCLFLTDCTSGGTTSGQKTETFTPFSNVMADSAVIFEPETISRGASDEFGITFTLDMRTLFFTSNRLSKTDYSIYRSDFQGGKWQRAEVASFSGEYFDADPFISPDGERVYFFSMRPFGSDTVPLSIPNIWFVEKKGGEWSSPKPVSGLVNSETSGEGYMSLANNNTIYFSSVGRLNGKNHDVFMSRQHNDFYELPVHLRLDIETSFSNPYILPGAEYLILDSRQAGGFGGNDLYLIKRTGENSWAEPVNMGGLVNTTGDEGTPGLTPDGRWFFFSRDGDIYFIDRKKLGF